MSSSSEDEGDLDTTVDYDTFRRGFIGRTRKDGRPYNEGNIRYAYRFQRRDTSRQEKETTRASKRRKKEREETLQTTSPHGQCIALGPYVRGDVVVAGGMECVLVVVYQSGVARDRACRSSPTIYRCMIASSHQSVSFSPADRCCAYVSTSHSSVFLSRAECSQDSLSIGDDDDDDDSDPRGSWDNKLQFILACVGCSVGLGSLWRFPYLAYTSGGGSFLVPYYLIRLTCGIPLLYMELAIGQFTRRGPIGTFSKLCPLLKGAGVASVVVAFFMSTYYSMIIAYAIFYFFSAFRSNLPWNDCSHKWNTEHCWPSHHANRTKPAQSESPAEEFFVGKLLKQSSGIEELGGVRWELAACLLFAWIIVYFALWKSVRSSGRVLYFTATLPFILVLAFLGRSLTLEGADLGLDFLFKPNWELLKDSKVWIYAAAQNFNSIGIAYGGVITFASYNKETNRILPDTLLISAINDIACMIIAVFAFATIGNISTEHQTSIETAISDNPGLVFIVYSTAMSKMPFSSFWAVLFFFMLLCLGLNTQFAIVEVVVTSIQDGFPNWIKKKVLCHELLVFVVCSVSFVLGFPLVTQGGIFFFQLIDHYAVCNSIVYIAFFEVIAVAWFYGAGRLSTNVERMSGEITNIYFKFCWVIAAPILIFFVWIFGLLDYTGLSSDNGYQFPVWANVFGWSVMAVCLLCIPILLVYVTMLAEGKNFFKKLCNATKPRIEDIPPPVKETEVKEMKTLIQPIRVKSNSVDHIVIKCQPIVDQRVQ